jgi:hypothetical protein
MPETTPGGFTYPVAGDAANVAFWLKAIAEKAEEKLATQADINNSVIAVVVQTPRGEDARSLGVPTDGVSDCAAAFAAIPAHTGRIAIRGKFIANSRITLAKGNYFAGGGWFCSGQPTFGYATFDSFISGTLIKFTNPASAGLLMDALSASKMSDVAIIGPGSGTNVGLQVGGTSQGLGNARIENVKIGNFSTGFYGKGMMESTAHGLSITGCGTGLRLSDAANGNAFTGLYVETCSVAPIDIAGCTSNTFTGGVLQGNSGAASIKLGTAAHANIFTGMYIEDVGATYSVDGSLGADFNQFVGLHIGYGTTHGKMRLLGAQNLILCPESQVDIELAANSSNVLIGHFSGTITNPGNGNLTIDTRAGGAGVQIGPRDIRVNSGYRLYLETSGTGSFIGRAPATGDTEIGTATGVIVRAADSGPVQINKYVTTTLNLALTDLHHLVDCNMTATGRTMTLPTAVGRAGKEFVIRKSDASANLVTIATTSSQTINGAAPGTLTAQYQFIRVVSDGANWMAV